MLQRIQSLLVILATFFGVLGAILSGMSRSISHYHFFFKKEKDKKVNKNQLNKMFVWGFILIVLAIIAVGIAWLIEVFSTYP